MTAAAPRFIRRIRVRPGMIFWEIEGIRWRWWRYFIRPRLGGGLLGGESDRAAELVIPAHSISISPRVSLVTSLERLR